MAVNAFRHLITSYCFNSGADGSKRLSALKGKMERGGTAIEDLDALAEKAETAFLRQDWASSAEAYEELVRSRPDRRDFKLKLARSYEELGRFDDAIEILNDHLLEEVPQTKRRLATVLRMNVALLPARVRPKSLYTWAGYEPELDIESIARATEAAAARH